MELQQLITFYTIVNQGSFSKASKKLGYTQAAVTIQIQHLEDELGSKLFDRFGHCISLTSNGQIFYRHTQKILSDVAAARASINTSEKINGHLRIGTIDSLCTTSLDQLLESYHQSYPLVSFSITTDSIEGLLNKLSGNDIDFAYLVDRQIIDPRFTKLSEKEERAYFAVRKEHPLLKKAYLTYDDILAYPLILTERNASYRTLLDHDMERYGYEVMPIIEAENTDLILRLVTKSDSITFLPNYLIKDHLTRLPINYNVTIYRQLLYHKNKWISPAMQSFFSLLKSRSQDM